MVHALVVAAVTLKMATIAPTGSRWEKTLSSDAAEVAKHTSSRVTFQYTFDADEATTVAQIKAGTLDGGMLTGPGLAMIDPSIQVLELPLMFASPEEARAVRVYLWKYFQKKFEKLGYTLGDPLDVGEVHLLSLNKIPSVGDLMLQKVWAATGDLVMIELFAQLGVTAIPLGVAAVEPNLRAHKIDTCYAPPVVAMTLGWEPPKIEYVSATALSYPIGATLIASSALANVAADDQKVMRKIGKHEAGTLSAAFIKDNDSSLKQLKRKGAKIAPVADVTGAAQATWDALAGTVYSQSELDLVRKYRNEYRAKH